MTKPRLIKALLLSVADDVLLVGPLIRRVA
jgi:hypothetical protein